MIKFVLTCSRHRGVLRAYVSSSTTSLADKLTDFFFLDGFYIFFFIHFIHGVSRLLDSPAATRLITHFFHSKDWKKKWNISRTHQVLPTYILFRLFDRPSMQHSVTSLARTTLVWLTKNEKNKKNRFHSTARMNVASCAQTMENSFIFFIYGRSLYPKKKKREENYLNSETRKEIMIKKVYIISEAHFWTHTLAPSETMRRQKKSKRNGQKKTHTFIKSKVDFSVRLKEQKWQLVAGFAVAHNAWYFWKDILRCNIDKSGAALPV